jgi:N-succinyldiaminopimelate aminotransferase
LPKFPSFSDKLTDIPGATWEKYRDKMITYGKDLVRLHIGDCYKNPAYPLPLQEHFIKMNPKFNRYCDTFGIPELREILALKLREDNGLRVNSENIIVSVGATGGLSAAVHSILNEGEDILVLTPFWPILRGTIASSQVNLIEVPFYTELYQQPDLDIVARLKSYLTKKTAAIYLNTPNNPSGKVLDRQQLRQVAEFAREHKLWVISDEAYDGLTYDGHEHISIASLPDIFPQTISVFTFSKIYMFAGLRLGYAVGSRECMVHLNKIMVHQLYSPSTFIQNMMIKPVKTRRQWQPQVKAFYQDLRDSFINQLAIPLIKPEATYFLFFPITPFLKGRDYDKVIEAFFENGVSVAPGADFGVNFDEYIRVCFTGEYPERLEKGIIRLRQVLEG